MQITLRYPLKRNLSLLRNLILAQGFAKRGFKINVDKTKDLIPDQKCVLKNRKIFMRSLLKGSMCQFNTLKIW